MVVGALVGGMGTGKNEEEGEVKEKPKKRSYHRRVGGALVRLRKLLNPGTCNWFFYVDTKATVAGRTRGRREWLISWTQGDSGRHRKAAARVADVLQKRWRR